MVKDNPIINEVTSAEKKNNKNYFAQCTRMLTIYKE